MFQALANWLRVYPSRLGALRSTLTAGALLVAVLAPDAPSVIEYDAFGFFMTAVLPTLAPLFVSGLLLDSLMCVIHLEGLEGSDRDRIRLALRSDLVIALIVVLAWVPFFLSIVS